MQGFITFTALSSALQAGYQMCDRTEKVSSCASKRKPDGHSLGSIASDEGAGSPALLKGERPKFYHGQGDAHGDHAAMSVLHSVLGRV
jgi:hypothetical protein